jgi:hypothetical protein
MSAIVHTDWNGNRAPAGAEMALSAGFEEVAMREKLAAARDTLIVLGLQLVFRAVMLLRRWNY